MNTLTKIQTITGPTPNVSFEIIKKMNKKNLEEIEETRNKFKAQKSNSRIYPQLPPTNGVVSFIIIGFFVSLVCSCNNNLFISSNGKIREKNILWCYSMN